MPDFTVKIEGFMLGMFRAAGETVRLTDAQALSFLREGRIAPADAPRTSATRDKAARG